MSKIAVGMTAERCVTVTEELTAAAVGSGTLRVYATPALIALCERTCAGMVEELLDHGITSVGTHIDIEHLSPTPVGDRVTCRASVTAFDGRRIDFAVEVSDSAGIIGSGTHTRCTVKSDSFLKKCYEKSAQ